MAATSDDANVTVLEFEAIGDLVKSELALNHTTLAVADVARDVEVEPNKVRAVFQLYQRKHECCEPVGEGEWRFDPDALEA